MITRSSRAIGEPLGPGGRSTGVPPADPRARTVGTSSAPQVPAPDRASHRRASDADPHPDVAAQAYADVVVIGAGQAGLSAAYHLRRAGLVPADAAAAPSDIPAAPRASVPGAGPATFVVLDAGLGPGGAWQDRWPSLTMRTVHGVYELPGRDLPTFDPDEPASRAVSGYFADYEREADLRVRRPVTVRRVRDLGGPAHLLAVETWDASPRGASRVTGRAYGRGVDPLGGGAGTGRPISPDHAASQADASADEPDVPVARTWRTRAVINATGTWTKPFWPQYPGRESFGGRQLHTHDFRSADDFAGRRVLVVGAGTSAVQLLLQIAPVAARTTWVTRRPPAWRDEQFTPELGREAVALVAERTAAGLPPESVVSVTGLPLTEAYRAGIAAGVLLARPMFDRLVTDGAFWTPEAARGPLAPGWVTGAEHVEADTILWATGFRYALGHLAPLHLRAAGGGILMDGTQSVAEPRLQLVGYGPSASTVGGNRAGREAARRVRRLLSL